MRPAFHAKKLRDLELRSGSPARRGQKGPGYSYNLAEARAQERRRVEQAERAYERFVSGWKPTGPPKRATNAAAADG